MLCQALYIFHPRQLLRHCNHMFRKMNNCKKWYKVRFITIAINNLNKYTHDTQYARFNEIHGENGVLLLRVTINTAS